MAQSIDFKLGLLQKDEKHAFCGLRFAIKFNLNLPLLPLVINFRNCNVKLLHSIHHHPLQQQPPSPSFYSHLLATTTNESPCKQHVNSIHLVPIGYYLHLLIIDLFYLATIQMNQSITQLETTNARSIIL